MRALAVLLAAAAMLPTAARAEFQFSAYGGMNTANNSDVMLSTTLVSGTYDVDWFGDSFHMPPYWGVRGTWWLTNFDLPHIGVSVDYTHAKVKADLDTIPFDRLEFTDGLNTITANALYRMPISQRFTLYGGGGVGVAFPHVEVTTIPNQGQTFEYQVTGPAVEALIGASMDIAYGVSVFAEYKANYSWNHADLNGGGTLETDVLTHNFAVGLSLSLGAQPQY